MPHGTPVKGQHAQIYVRGTWDSEVLGKHTMFVKCWAIVCDTGPTFSQPSVNMSCFLDVGVEGGRGWRGHLRSLRDRKNI